MLTSIFNILLGICTEYDFYVLNFIIQFVVRVKPLFRGSFLGSLVRVLLHCYDSLCGV